MLRVARPTLAGMAARVLVCALVALGCSGSAGSQAGKGGSAGSAGSQGTASGGGASGGAAGSGGAGIDNGAFTVVVDRADYQLTIKSKQPAAGNRFVTVALTLSNVSVAAPLRSGPENFSLRTDNSLVVLASGASALLAPSCRADLAVAAGGMNSCRLAFELATTESPTELVYDDQQGHVYSAKIPPIVTPATACEKAIGLSLSSQACKDCINASCIKPALAWSDAHECADDDACIKQCTTGCPCAYDCLATPGCRDLYDAFSNCIVDSCAPACL